MVSLIKAPSINSIDIEVLSANFAKIKWDDVGRNFYYLIEMRDVTNGGEWNMLTHLKEPSYTIDNLESENEYQIRVAVSSKGFEASEWVYSDVFKTFMYNLYNFSLANELTLSDNFIDEKFTTNNRNFINFNNDVIYASLMDSDFKYVPSLGHVSYMRDRILRRSEYHEILGSVTKLCTDVDRVMVGYIDDVLYLVERYQRIAKVSNNKGQTWQTVELFGGRVGDPISNTIFSQSATTTYALGYDHIFYGRPSSNVRWSSIRERFSQTDVSFTRMDDKLKLGFEIEVFNRYAPLPNGFDKGRAEAFACNSRFIVVASNGKIAYIDTTDVKYDEDPDSPTYQQRIFNDEILELSADESVVVKKIDAVGDDILVLVTGKLKSSRFNKRHPDNIEYSDDIGVYKVMVDDKSIIRVFGNTQEERDYIEHEFTNMSTNGTEFFINYANFDRNEMKERVVEDEDDGKVKYNVLDYVHDRGYLNTAKPLMGSMRAKVGDVDNWERGFMKYYMETHFTYMARSRNRTFITNERKIGLVYGERLYTQVVELEGSGSEDRIMSEVWKDGMVRIYTPNITFKDFNSYASGVLLYQSNGSVIGFYEFFTNVINEVSIIWKPKHVLLEASLIGQSRPELYVEAPLKRPEDPNLVPFIKKMIPENYFRDSDIEQSRFYTFIQNYLEYLSDGRDSSYKGALNSIRNKDPFEVDSLEYLWSEMYKRNIYLDSKKKEETIKFFLSRKNDFYSAKGTIASYKFLFKLLYNEDVEIDDDTNVMNYYLTVDMPSIDQNIIGQTIFSPTGRCIVTNIERVYIDGKKRWQLSIGSMVGVMKKGQVFRSENSRYSGTVVEELLGKQLLYNDLDYINNGRSYYVMRVKSTLPISRYKDDMVRFVHPLGVGFKGIVDITLFMNAGLNLRHTETIIDKYISLRFGMGAPTHYPDRIRMLNTDGTPNNDDTTGAPFYLPHPMNGEEYVIDVDAYNLENEVDTSLIKNPAIREYVENTTPNERRRRYSPLFDSSSTTLSKYRSMVDNFIGDGTVWRLKDNVGNPRDPSDRECTQQKLREEI